MRDRFKKRLRPMLSPWQHGPYQFDGNLKVGLIQAPETGPHDVDGITYIAPGDGL